MCVWDVLSSMWTLLPLSHLSLTVPSVSEFMLSFLFLSFPPPCFKHHRWLRDVVYCCFSACFGPVSNYWQKQKSCLQVAGLLEFLVSNLMLFLVTFTKDNTFIYILSLVFIVAENPSRYPQIHLSRLLCYARLLKHQELSAIWCKHLFFFSFKTLPIGLFSVVALDYFLTSAPKFSYKWGYDLQFQVSHCSLSVPPKFKWH